MVGHEADGASILILSLSMPCFAKASAGSSSHAGAGLLCTSLVCTFMASLLRKEFSHVLCEAEPFFRVRVLCGGFCDFVKDFQVISKTGVVGLL